MIELFRLRGIPIRVDFGWVLVLGLISWGLASAYFPYVLPDLSPVQYWLHGLLAAVLLFVSVLLHELSHALMAREHGVPVGGITLHIFGGVSQLDAEPPTPRAEALIAVVGPLTSFAIAGVCSAADRAASGPAWMHALLGYLAAVNFVVGLFNLVPGFPLDGGRLLRAALWAWTGTLVRATRVASRVGSVVAFVLIAAGVARMLVGDVISGAWFALIGLFLHQAARGSWELMRVRTRLEALRIDEVMAPPVAQENGTPPRAPEVVSPRDSAWVAFLKVARSPGGRVVVVDNDQLVGVVSQRELRRALALDAARADVVRRAA